MSSKKKVLITFLGISTTIPAAKIFTILFLQIISMLSSLGFDWMTKGFSETTETFQSSN